MNTDEEEPQTLSWHGFLGRVAELKGSIEGLSSDVNTSQRQVRQIAIENGIRALEEDLKGSSRYIKMKEGQLRLLKTLLKEEKDRYRRAEQKRCNDDLAQRIQSANPGVTYEQAQQVLRDPKYDDANELLKNVRGRHNEISDMERTIEGLLPLCQETLALVTQQGQTTEQIENNTEKVVQDNEKSLEALDDGVHSASRARKNKYWCLLIAIIITMVIAGGICLGLCMNGKCDRNK
ncbi:hypothetical protein H633G_11268 [Metarhizium anisopliae BRIP 53284]|nr:hypothetical protein H633G_11268 [Metarhizium anisopliae BRIP 53284]